MGLLSRLIGHEGYMRRVKKERGKIQSYGWSADKMDGYIQSYMNHGFPMTRALFSSLPFFGEPALVQACITESAYQKFGDKFQTSF